jgi:hypothetical protein
MSCYAGRQTECGVVLRNTSTAFVSRLVCSLIASESRCRSSCAEQILHIYTRSQHTRACRVGYGDITPASLAEIWINVFIQIAGLALFASILSGIQEIIASSSRKSRHDAALRSKLTDVQACFDAAFLALELVFELVRLCSCVR